MLSNISQLACYCTVLFVVITVVLCTSAGVAGGHWEHLPTKVAFRRCACSHLKSNLCAWPVRSKAAQDVTIDAACVGSLMVCTCAGDLQTVRWLPSLDPPGMSSAAAIMQLLAVVPILMTAYICQFAIHPLMQDLKAYSTSKMTRIVKITLVVCSGLYLAFGIGGYALFGDQTQGDALSNFNFADLSPRFGKNTAKVR